MFSRQNFPVLLCCFLSLALLQSCRQPAPKLVDGAAPVLKSESGKPAESPEKIMASIKDLEAKSGNEKEELSLINRLVFLLLKERKTSEAGKYAEKALSMAERIYGPNDLKVLEQLNILKKVAQQIPDRSKTGECIDRMIEIQEKNSGADSVPVMWLLSEYALNRSPFCGDKYDTGKLKHLIRLREKFASADDVDTLRFKSMLADGFAQEGNISEAIASYESCIDTAKKVRPGLVAELCLHYGRCSMRYLKDRTRAIKVLKESYSICGPDKSTNAIIAPEVAEELADALYSNNQKKDAAAIYKDIITTLRFANNSDRLRYFEDRYKECSK